jgi:hypothetical protein
MLSAYSKWKNDVLSEDEGRGFFFSLVTVYQTARLFKPQNSKFQNN